MKTQRCDLRDPRLLKTRNSPDEVLVQFHRISDGLGDFGMIRVSTWLHPVLESGVGGRAAVGISSGWFLCYLCWVEIE